MSNVDNMNMKEIFSRTESLLGGSAMEKLKKAAESTGLNVIIGG